MSKKRKFYEIQAKQQSGQNVVEIRVYDEIGFWGITAADFAKQLDDIAAEAEKIVVSINSPGGSVFDAFAMYNAIARHNLPVQTRVDGVAASAASLLFMSGDERVMPENTMIMVHNAWVWTGGTADDLRHTADMMDKIRDSVVAAYARSGQEDTEIIEMMDKETWISALDAHAMGFATAIENPVEVAMSANSVQLLEKLKNTPKDLLELLSKSKPEPKAAQPVNAGDSVNVVLSASELVAYTLSACQEAGLSNLSESILMSGGLDTKEAVDSRVEQAEKIALFCASAKLPEKATDFIKAGLSAEQVQARLFEAVVSASDSISISNLQRESSSEVNSTKPVASLSPLNVYAARKAAILN